MNRTSNAATRGDTRPFDEIDQRCVDTLRFLSVKMMQSAGSGHPSLPLDAAPMAWVLRSRFLRHDPAEPRPGRSPCNAWGSKRRTSWSVRNGY